MISTRDRALGSLAGLAVGDALGMPTQLLHRDEIVRRYGSVLRGFEPAPSDHPIAAGMPAGSVTDDTDQAVIVAEALIAGDGVLDARDFADRLVAWESAMIQRGSLDLPGPSTKRALAAILAGGDPAETGRYGDTNGAAMRVAPVGIATRPEASALVEAVVEASRPTHNTGIALSGAAAVAAAVSVGVEGGDPGEQLAAAVAAARAASSHGRWVAGADVADRIEWAVGLVAGLDDDAACDVVFRLVGTSLATQESVPAAFAIWSLHAEDAWRCCRVAASVGGDCDTIAAMAGAMVGSHVGVAGFPDDAVATIGRVNSLDLDGLADGLLALRARS